MGAPVLTFYVSACFPFWPVNLMLPVGVCPPTPAPLSLASWSLWECLCPGAQPTSKKATVWLLEEELRASEPLCRGLLEQELKRFYQHWETSHTSDGEAFLLP